MNVLRLSSMVSAFAAMVLILGACGDDPVAGGQTSCPADDETWHPIEEECVADDGANGVDGNNETGNQNNDANGDDTNGDDTNGDDNGGDNNGTDGVEECGPGDIEGQSCRPDGEILAGAEVTVTGEDCEDGEPFEMTTEADGEGYYSFEDVPAGEHTLTIESGSFSNQQPVTVIKDETTDLLSEAAKVCVEGSQVSIAVLEGTFDDIGTILDGIDIDYDSIGGDFDDIIGGGDAADLLADIDEMREYDIIFIECGNLWDNLEGDFDDFLGGGDADEILDNIEQYLQEGNSLYASDWAHPFIQEALPEVVEFYQEDDSDVEAPRAGAGSQEVEADVVSTQMQDLLGGDETTTLTFDAGNWAVAEDGGAESTVHFESDVELTEDGQTVDEAALMITDEGALEGDAIFTSFHNNDQATGDMEEILEYMIFQL